MVSKSKTHSARTQTS